MREGVLPPAGVVADVLARLPDTGTRLRPVLNATGVLLHTNLGWAPLSAAVIEALGVAAGTTDVELDLTIGGRGRRGADALGALAEAVPAAPGVHVVNNGAAALVLAATALAAGREIVLARGEMVEIGDGFRIPDLLVSTGARLCEVGTTNRVRREDYAAAIGPQTGFVLKVHPSNFRITGFTSSVPVTDLTGLGVPVVVDIGFAEEVRELVAEDAPQVFALVEEYGERVDGRIVAWDMAFDDHVDVLSVHGGMHASLPSVERAHRAFSRHRKIRLVWTSPATTREWHSVL